MATVRQVMMSEYEPPGLDCFGQQLNRAARAKEVEFSGALHRRILRATIGQRLVCLAGKSRQCFAPTFSPLSTCCVATTALLIVCVVIVVTPSPLALPPAEQAPSQTSISFTDVAATLAEATDEVESIASLASEELVDSLVLQHIDFLERHAKDIASVWLDPLPSSVSPELHEPPEDVNKDS